MAIVNPFELNGGCTSFTTSWFRGSDEYEKSLEMYKDMVNLKGVIAYGASYELPLEFGRGELKSQIMDKKDKLSPTFFALNYASEWVGNSGNELVKINKVMDLRTLSKAELERNKHDDEYIISVDVARSQSSNNNQCSVAVLKIKRNKSLRIVAIQLVNVINIPSMLNFQVQAQEIMRIKNRYGAKMCVIDANGLGRLMPPYIEIYIENLVNLEI